jgi:hypothetical protein
MPEKFYTIIIILFCLICVCGVAGCELQDTEKNNYDYTAEYLNNRCDIDGQINYYPVENGGECMRCEFGFWREFNCEDFCR